MLMKMKMKMKMTMTMTMTINNISKNVLFQQQMQLCRCFFNSSLFCYNVTKESSNDRQNNKNKTFAKVGGGMWGGKDEMLLATPPNVFTYTSSINDLAKVGKMDEAMKQFQAMKEIYSIEPNIATYTCLIGGLAKAGDRDDQIFHLVQEMAAHKIASDMMTTLNILIGSFMKMGDFVNPAKIVKIMETKGVKPNIVTYTCLAEGYARAGKMKESLRTVKKMEIIGLKPSIITYNLIVHGLVKSGGMDKALRIVDDTLPSKHLSPTVETYSILINGYGKQKRMEEAEKLFAKMESNQIHPNIVTYNTMIDGYARVGMMEKAEETLNRIKSDPTLMQKQIIPDEKTYSAIINGYANLGNIDAIARIVGMMERDNILPDTITYSSIVKAYCKKNPPMLTEAENVLEIMNKKKIPKTDQTYSPIITALTKENKIDEACKRIETMKAEGTKPSPMIFAPLIQTNIQDVVQWSFNQMIKEKLKPDNKVAGLNKYCLTKENITLYTKWINNSF